MAKNGQKNQKGPKGGQEPQKYELSFYYKQQETHTPRPNHIADRSCFVFSISTLFHLSKTWPQIMLLSES